MAKLVAHMRLIAGALALAFIVAISAPVSAQQPSMVNPTADAVKEQQLLQQLKMIQGRVTIPDVKSSVLEHPAGREWRQFHTVTLKWIGGISILGMLAVLVIFYLWRGPMRVKSGYSGINVLRFDVLERFVHWLTAVTFVILGITGLNITFGRALLLPWMGPEAFSAWSEWAKYAHNYLSFAFTLGVLLMFVMWIGRNLPTAVDVEWLKQGGGMFDKTDSTHAPAYKFNAGQKILFWVIVFSSAAMVISGFMLMFPILLGADRRQHGAGADLPRRRRCVVRRAHSRPYLSRHCRDGRCVRGNGRRQRRSQLGQGTSQSLGQGGDTGG